uniref:Uncharacterized protein n=1 Tax=Chromera velia CCMP2878 TaxID=1169474 RepID=A0A0G4FRM6_9ALVE|eukprot:Cvel_18246.t1-p1 / transcript=Cvel_18246.t1 / gene=Cvel_18246 / organism=Chromera_velia_CCMP2878 / gene_product=hypothetical protein / transcript_product=hypothetical protein / location=Cvel_scaffold1501:18379-18690(+) / protein_length=104 / sequence_SO=supercontig / SO=protein_coding / is_pseudo=false
MPEADVSSEPWELSRDAVNILARNTLTESKPSEEEDSEEAETEKHENEMVAYGTCALQLLCVFALQPVLFNLDPDMSPTTHGWRVLIPGYSVGRLVGWLVGFSV